MSFAFNNKKPPPLGRAGVTSLEFAVIALAFIFTVFSVVDLADYLIVLQSVATVTTEAARWCLVNPADCPASGGTNGMWSQLTTLAPLLDPAQFSLSTLTVAYDPVTGYPLGMIVTQVTVSYPFSPITPWMAMLAGTVSESATYFN